jgi:hypothetical protein
MENNDELPEVSLIPINCSTGEILESTDDKCSLSDIITKERQQQQYDTSTTIPDVTIVFCIRRSGCGGCKENGQILSKLLTEYTNISCFGILKEINVDNDSLLNFYQDYFTYPLYVDKQWTIYKFLGDRKISYYTLLIYTPFALYRYYKKSIPNVSFGGDIFTLGGLLFYDKNGILVTKYYEKYGEPFETTMLRSIIRNIKKNNIKNTNIQ